MLSGPERMRCVEPRTCVKRCDALRCRVRVQAQRKRGGAKQVGHTTDLASTAVASDLASTAVASDRALVAGLDHLRE